MTEQVRRYETLILAIPEITSDESRELEQTVTDIIKSGEGQTISYDRWGKYRLAYPIKKQEYGVYYLIRFEATAEKAIGLLAELKSAFTIKLNKVVMRSMTTTLDPNGSLEYTRPESLEETPKDVDSFLRENKMDGLISKDRDRGPRDRDRDRGPRRPYGQSAPQKTVTATTEVVEETTKAESQDA